MITERQPLSNVQLEILKTFSYSLSEQDLAEMKKLLANFFAKRAIALADKVWDEQGWDDKKVENLLNTKLRSRKNK
jgi:predicted transcriptional regulator